jgi:hypothetical protein
MTEEPVTFEERKWREEKSREDMERAHDQMHDDRHKITDAAIQSGQITIRTAALMNGGAAVVVLGFVGGLIGQGRVEVNQINTIAGSLMWFVYGVAAAVCSLGSAYIVNYCRRWQIDTLQETSAPPYFVSTAISDRWKQTTRLFQLIALIVGVLSLVFFVVGMWDLRDSIGELKPMNAPRNG